MSERLLRPHPRQRPHRALSAVQDHAAQGSCCAPRAWPARWCSSTCWARSGSTTTWSSTPRRARCCWRTACLCCAMRDDLKTALKDLHSRRDRGGDTVLRTHRGGDHGNRRSGPHRLHPAGRAGAQHHYAWATWLRRRRGQRPGAARPVRGVGQAGALADRLVLSKLDLAGAPAPWMRYARGSRRSTPTAADHRRRRARTRSGRAVDYGRLPPAVEEPRGGTLDALDPGGRGGGRCAYSASGGWPRPEAGVVGHRSHRTAVTAFCFTFDAALDWTAFGVWMSMLLHRHVTGVLRMKGLLNVAGVPGPVL